MKGIVYILQSEVNHRYYIGSTADLPRRLVEHNSGASKYTRLTKPFQLVYFQEYPTLAEARRSEYRLKCLKSRKLIDRLITSARSSGD